MKSSLESRATVPQRCCPRRTKKLAENQCCVTGKVLQLGGGRMRGRREGGGEQWMLLERLTERIGIFHRDKRKVKGSGGR